jgi:hypothetical protein
MRSRKEAWLPHLTSRSLSHPHLTARAAIPMLRIKTHAQSQAHTQRDPCPTPIPSIPFYPVPTALPALQAHSFHYRSELLIYSSSASPTLTRSYLYPVYIFTLRNHKKLRLKAESEAFPTNKAHSICAILGGKERSLHPATILLAHLRQA